MGIRWWCSGSRGWDLNPDLSATVSELFAHSQWPHLTTNRTSGEEGPSVGAMET